MNNIDLAKLYHFDEMFDNTSKPHSCYKDYYKWLSSEEPGNLKKQQIEANEFFKKIGITFNVYGDLEEEEIGFEYTEEDNIKAKRKRTLTTSKAILTVNDRAVPIVFVPNPSSRMAKALKKNAWDWALKSE